MITITLTDPINTEPSEIDSLIQYLHRYGSHIRNEPKSRDYANPYGEVDDTPQPESGSQHDAETKEQHIPWDARIHA